MATLREWKLLWPSLLLFLFTHQIWESKKIASKLPALLILESHILREWKLLWRSLLLFLFCSPNLGEQKNCSKIVSSVNFGELPYRFGSDYEGLPSSFDIFTRFLFEYFRVLPARIWDFALLIFFSINNLKIAVKLPALLILKSCHLVLFPASKDWHLVLTFFY